MIGLLIADLDKEMTEAETTEKDSQADYEELMKDSADKRAADSKSLADKESAKAGLQGDLEKLKDTLKEGQTDLASTLKYIHDLHMECDWLLEILRRAQGDASERGGRPWEGKGGPERSGLLAAAEALQRLPEALPVSAAYVGALPSRRLSSACSSQLHRSPRIGPSGSSRGGRCSVWPRLPRSTTSGIVGAGQSLRARDSVDAHSRGP